MHWTDSAIILSVRRLGEHSGIVRLLTREQGLAAGVDRGAFSKRKRGLYQPGNRVEATWQARLPEHMGTLSCELTQATAARLLDDRCKLAALSSAVLMVEKMLPERERQPEVYAAMESVIAALCDDREWLVAYVHLEYTLLATAGFGLDLERCAATGQAHDLIYVSPRSGRAVSRHAGEPYRDRLLKLPAFLRDALETAELPQILEGLALCGHFLAVRVFAPRGSPPPQARVRFLQALAGWKAPELSDVLPGHKSFTFKPFEP